jgi:hypothetical protein
MRVFRNYATMGGFRFRGQYSKGRAPTFAMPSNKVVTSPGDLGGMTAKTGRKLVRHFLPAPMMVMLRQHSR